MHLLCFIMVAACVKKVAYGLNSTRRDYTGTSTHAEMDALAKIIGKGNKTRKLDLIVIKLTKTGQLGESRPCHNCLRRLYESGVNIKHVYYSTSKGTMEKENFNSMLESPRTYVSYGMRCRNVKY